MSTGKQPGKHSRDKLNELNVYIFRDEHDRRKAIVIASSKAVATRKLKEETNLPFELIDVESVEDNKVIIVNEMLPF